MTTTKKFCLPCNSLTYQVKLELCEGRVISGLSCGYGGHLAALLNCKSPSNYAHPPPTTLHLLLRGLVGSYLQWMWASLASHKA